MPKRRKWILIVVAVLLLIGVGVPAILKATNDSAVLTALAKTMIDPVGAMSNSEQTGQVDGTGHINADSIEYADFNPTPTIAPNTNIAGGGAFAAMGEETPTPPTGVTTGHGDKLNTYKDVTLRNGIWRDAYTRIFSGLHGERVAEISNYPRAYRDTVAHVYEEDVSFTVTEGDLNSEANGTRYYYDPVDETYHGNGTKATHHEGEPLPGQWPKWLEYETPQLVGDTSGVKFDTRHIPGKNITSLESSELGGGNLTDSAKDDYKSDIENKDVITTSDKPILSTDRKVIYIRYERWQ